MVRNPSFESSLSCPMGLDELMVCNFWEPFGTNHPSPDYFKGCANPETVGAPENAFGYQQAKSGNAYVGLIGYLSIDSKNKQNWELSNNHREFIQTKLKEPLRPNQKYYAEFHINLVEDCDYVISSLGMLLSEEKPELTWAKIQFEYHKPQIQSDSTRLLDNADRWVKISGTFVANGEEKYLTIGNFSNDENTVVERNTVKKNKNVFRNKHLPKMAYYLIDDVKLTPVDSLGYFEAHPILVSNEKIQSDYFGPLIIGSEVTLDNIYFEFDKAILLPGSFDELNKLVDLLNENPEIQIKIEGHTDGVGSNHYNLNLSKQRAKAVTDYLASQGISRERVSHVGYGKNYPIADNTTEDGRALNRRVKFVVIKR
ncbi:OmpA family protein [Fulvivirgaceae bacterium BMA10]|uniref:OmpA family protein n=1 Tax=Splendidivirga corallicola TaxID=3051826 RepID=A0ABT8KV49_9BACT|nr:OmpA family protein [Fulvivirgaceae bacterium BMA10]